MNKIVKQFADEKDVEQLKYIFVDALDVDPTFVKYEEEYNYCKAIPGILEEHIEMTPFVQDSAQWNEAYWGKLKADLLENFSDRRMTHMRAVAKVFLAEKIERLLKERAEKEQKQICNEVPSVKMSKETVSKPVQEEAKTEVNSVRSGQSQKKYEQPKQAVTPRRREVVRAERTYEQAGGSSKKAVGIAIAAALVGLAAMFLLMND